MYLLTQHHKCTSVSKVKDNDKNIIQIQTTI